MECDAFDPKATHYRQHCTLGEHLLWSTLKPRALFCLLSVYVPPPAPTFRNWDAVLGEKTLTDMVRRAARHMFLTYIGQTGNRK